MLPTSLAHADDVLADREDILARRPPRGRPDHGRRAGRAAAELVSEHEVYRTAAQPRPT